MIRLLAVTFLFMLISGGAVAAPFSVSYVGTMENPTTAGQFFPNIVNGETYKVTLVMDNVEAQCNPKRGSQATW